MNIMKINKILFGKSLPTRVFIVILLGFGLKLFFSCTPPSPIEIHYNSINIIGINNSDRFMDKYTSVDTMYSGAVALKLSLFDSTYNYYAFNFYKSLKSLSFTPAMALTIDESYIPVNKVEQIKIRTLFDIDESVKAGDDISNLIVYDAGSDFKLYQNLNYAIASLNGSQATADSSIVMALRTSIANTKAQFEVKITLDNGYELSFITGIFSIITQ